MVRKLPTCFLVCILVGLPLGAFAGPEPSTESEPDRALTAFFRILEEGDREAMADLLADEWELYITLPDVQAVATRERFLGLFNANFGPGNLKIVPEKVYWSTGDDTAWCRVEEHHHWFSGTDQAQPPKRMLSTYIFEKRHGAWLLVQTHHSWISDKEKESQEERD